MPVGQLAFAAAVQERLPKTNSKLARAIERAARIERLREEYFCFEIAVMCDSQSSAFPGRLHPPAFINFAVFDCVTCD